MIGMTKRIKFQYFVMAIPIELSEFRLNARKVVEPADKDSRKKHIGRSGNLLCIDSQYRFNNIELRINFCNPTGKLP